MFMRRGPLPLKTSILPELVPEKAHQKDVVLFEPISTNSWQIGRTLLNHHIRTHLCTEVMDVYQRLSLSPVAALILDVDTCAERLELIIRFARMKNSKIAIFLLASTESTYLHRVSMETGIPLYLKKNLSATMLCKAVVERISIRGESLNPHNVCDTGLQSLTQNVQEATAIDFGGEVVIRSRDGIARIYFVNSRIAWMYIHDSTDTLINDLATLEGIERDELKAVFLECRRTGTNFADTLVEWQIVSREQMYQILLSRFASCLNQISSWQNLCSIFIPEQRQYHSTFLFSLSEILTRAQPSELTRQLSLIHHPA
jgi:hypothetical protein